MNELVVGIDIGGTNTVIGIVDSSGNIVYKTSILTHTHSDINDYILDIYNEIEKGKSSIEKEFNIVGIGIGAPNANYYKGTIENAANMRWKGVVEFNSLLSKYYVDTPIFITNDANAAAIGEMVYGGAKNMKEFIVITLGTGLGSGIVTNGRLLYGSDGFAGEFGHIVVRRNGRECNCGRKGCLETYVSATGLVRTAFEVMSNSTKDSVLRDISFKNLTSKIIYEAAINNDSIAMESFEKTAQILGESLADYVSIASPEAIFMFGGLANSGDLLFDKTKYYMENSMLSIFSNKVKLLPSKLGENAAILGASALAWAEIN
jgi:glucokinase